MECNNTLLLIRNFRITLSTRNIVSPRIGVFHLGEYIEVLCIKLACIDHLMYLFY